MKIIERTQYIERIKRLRGTPDIKIITGMRRAGKSELLNEYSSYLNTVNSSINIIKIDFNDLLFNSLKEYMKLFEYVESKYVNGVENVLIIDEVQLCNKFELAINSFHNSKKYDIYITGSNAFLLSSDLTTLFTGRFIEISIFPFSFAEYCKYFELKDEYNKHLEKYLLEGGLAGAYLYKYEEDSRKYISDIYNTLLKRDLVDKYRISEIALLDSISEFLMDNISNLTTTNNISNILKSNKINSNHITIGNYIKHLCNAFMFYKVKRYDVKGKKYLETNSKYYLCDLSLRYSILGLRNMDYGRAYENIVAIELMRRGYEIYVGKLYQKEIDFVAIKNNKKIYIQVADNISSDETLDRELLPLKMIKDSYPKFLLANTNHNTYDIDGIKIVDISKWLMDNE
ncbi:ATP-binding protein [Streptobacillus felis]|uniref:ATP-binding protein n=1 Tax=Streptobacillus felis TaxID=1384509 RepID=A0A7Z0T8S0_9FUSO|nr:ATP-binding protein [Streptobacillus felis]NYV28234.1 ATP-binding protein [Streptobacillus felis]